MEQKNYEYIEKDNNGVPVIKDTKIRVADIVLSQNEMEFNTLDITKRYPSLMELQVKEAIKYYNDHKKELDEDIAKRKKQLEQFFSNIK